MYRFLLSRAIGLVFVLLCVTFITFIMGYIAPGNPVRALLGLHYTPELYSRLLHTYGLDLPWWQQYYNFLNNCLHGTFGLSFHYENRQAWDVIKDGFFYSVDLGLEVLAVTILMGIPIGIIAALRANTHVDTSLSTTILVFYAIPDIALIILFQLAMVWFYNQHLPSLPVAGWDSWQSHIAPVLITATTGAAYFSRITRSTILETLGQDYIRTARSKGLSERRVIWLHAMRNACIPLFSYVGYSLAFIVTGLFITENLFNIPGLASITISAVGDRDYPIIQATTVLISVAVVVCNALADLGYAMVDPRINIE
ncbi:MAG: ABC transporter permease [Ktedonobacteraceae bacterium]|nr:ABC transporter permease [Ktedonobacteraceae bacterium]